MPKDKFENNAKYLFLLFLFLTIDHRAGRKRPQFHARSHSVPASPRRAFFVPYCSNCLQNGLTNQNPLSAHIFIGVRGV